EYDRALLYLLALVLFGAGGRSVLRLRWMVWGLALAIVAIAVAALGARLVPDLVPTTENVHPDRLAFPLTYWNSLGVLMAIGLVLCGHLACSERDPGAVRVLGAASIPLLATTLYFTYSRGGTWTALVGVGLYAVLARPRGLVAGALATAPTTLIALMKVNPPGIVIKAPGTPAADQLGQEMALVIVLCAVAAGVIRLALLPLDRWTSSLAIPRLPRPAVAAAVVVGVLLAAGGAVAADAPTKAGDTVDRFFDEDTKPGGASGGRLLSASGNGRVDHWRVALNGFHTDELKGEGAGTYEIRWLLDRKGSLVVQDAHSLYLETLSELGIVGLLLLATALLALLGGVAWRVRGPDRALHAAVLAAMVVWIVHAGLDWDWEVPAVTLWLFALAGAAVAREPRRRDGGEPPRRGRTAVGIAGRVGAVGGCVLLALAPAQMALAQGELLEGRQAVQDGDCRAAVAHAAEALEHVDSLVGPRQLLTWCAVRSGDPRDGVAPMRAAIAKDPGNWEAQYDLAVALAAAGEDPRAPALAAIRGNRLDSLARVAGRLYAARTKAGRERLGRAAPLLLP
ncbi:MAG: O-antigen ligase family protein, partial [Solirubrobacterales bacterium]|nr:O-antigen ligase family protein [Solirubrobacterales bacterium]